MNVKTMEGLAGASTSMSMISIPMGVVKEAENKGDTEKMKRALGYAADLVEQAGKYKEKTSKGMELDAKEAKEQEKLRQEELIEAKKAEREEEKKQENTGFDSVKISEKGKYQAQASSPASAAIDGSKSTIYDKSGETVEPAAEPGENVNISV